MIRMPLYIVLPAIITTCGLTQPLFAQDDREAAVRQKVLIAQEAARKAAVEAEAAAIFAADAAEDANAPEKDEGEQVADTLQEMLQTLEQVTKMPIQPDTPPDQAAEQRMLQQEFSRVRSYMNRNDYMNARRQIRSWSRRASSPALKQTCRAIALELEKKVDAQVAPLIDRADDLLADAEKICTEAKEPEDLDDLAERFYEFSSFEFRINSQSRIVQRTRERIQAGQRYVDQYQQFLFAEQSGNDAQAFQILNQLTQARNYGYTIQLMPVSNLIERKQSIERRIMKEAQEKIASFDDKITIETSLDEVYSMQSELDMLYNEFSYSNMYNSRGRLDRARSTLQNWLAVLYAEEADDPRAALQQLQSMQSSSYHDHKLLNGETIAAKRKALLAKMGDSDNSLEDQIREIISSVKDASSAIAAQDKLDKFVNLLDNDLSQEMYRLRSDLGIIATAYRALEQDQGHQIWDGPTTTVTVSIHRWMEATDAIREKQLRVAIATALELDAFAPTADGETPAAGVLRLADAAAEAGDWQRVHDVLDLYKRAFAGNEPPAWLLAEIHGCQSYLAGQQLEKFGQTEQARDAYLEVLQQIGDRVPHPDAAKRLDALKAQ